jgi:hypothetical protein
MTMKVLTSVTTDVGAPLPAVMGTRSTLGT